MNSCSLNSLYVSFENDPRLSVTVINSIIVTFTSIMFNHFFRFLPGLTGCLDDKQQITDTNQMIICINVDSGDKQLNSLQFDAPSIEEPIIVEDAEQFEDPEAVEVKNLNELNTGGCRTALIAQEAVDAPADENTVNAVDLEQVEDEDVEDAGLQH